MHNLLMNIGVIVFVYKENINCEVGKNYYNIHQVNIKKYTFLVICILYII